MSKDQDKLQAPDKNVSFLAEAFKDGPFSIVEKTNVDRQSPESVCQIVAAPSLQQNIPAISFLSAKTLRTVSSPFDSSSKKSVTFQRGVPSNARATCSPKFAIQQLNESVPPAL
jgi:hypothetical protein